jgi:hemerythrin-like metal-binding protein
MLTWDPKLETGITEIDEQHQLLFRKAASVLGAVQAGQGGMEVARAIQFLADYAALHFETEERFMRASGFPEADTHAEIHRRINRRLMEVAADFNADGATAGLVADVEAMMRGWVTMHIMEKDRALAEWLAEQPRG